MLWMVAWFFKFSLQEGEMALALRLKECPRLYHSTLRLDEPGKGEGDFVFTAEML